MLRKPVVQILLFALAVSLALVAGNLVFANQQRDMPELSKRFRRYDVLKLDSQSTASQVRRTGKLVLKTSDGVFDLHLVPHDLRSNDYRAQVIGPNGVARPLPRTPVNTYKGFVRNMTGAEVRLTITDGSIEGAIIARDRQYFIQPARSLSKTANKDEFVFYDTQDLIDDPATSGVTLADQVAVEKDRTKDHIDTPRIGVTSSTNIDTPSPPKTVRLATDADAEYVAAFGGASQANNHIVSIMNQVDGVYSVELGITFQIVFQNAWTNPATDPYTSIEPFAPLSEFRSHWDANFGHIQRHLAHMWSGKEMPVPGAADFAVLCKPGFGYAFSGLVPTGPGNPITAATVGLTAHEIGHNFGGIHPFLPDVPPEIAADCGTSIMAGRAGTTFCDYSRSQIMGFITTFATCLPDSATSPTPPTCVDVPIVPGVAVSGALAATDCRSPSRGGNHFADHYSFDGQAGQRLVITMSNTSPGLEPFVFLIGPDGFITAQDVFNGPANSARIPVTGNFTLPLTGKYIIEATSFGLEQTGNYTLNVAPPGCVLTVTPMSQHFASTGGTGAINVTATGNNCAAGYQFTVWPNTTTWLQTHVLNGEGSQSLGFTVAAHSNTAGRRAFLIVGAAIGTQTGGVSIPITQSGTIPDCVLTPIAFGETVNSALTSTDCRSPLKGDNNVLADRYVFTATAGQEIAVLSSPIRGFTSNLTLVGPTSRIILTASDGAATFHSRIPGGNGMLKLGLPGQYVIEVTAAIPGFTGPYSLTLINNEPSTLLTEENSDTAAAVESVSLLRDPFPLTTPFNLSTDQQTRISLFADNLALQPGENQSAITAVAEDNQMNSYPLTVEFVGKVPGLGRLTQIIVKLPFNLPPGQELRVKITFRGKTSNKVRFRIK